MLTLAFECSPRLDGGPPSPTSTVMYSHEPFEDYSKRILRTIARLFPDALDRPSAFRMHGGTSNRVTGVIVSLPEGRKEFVYRTPRGSLPKQDAVALLKYLERNVSLPTPIVVVSRSDPASPGAFKAPLGAAENPSKDADDEHEEEAFILMERLKGVPVSSVYHTFSQSQKIDFARQFANLMVEIFDIPVPRVVGTVHSSGTETLAVHPFIEDQVIWPAADKKEEAKPTKDELPSLLIAASYFTNLFKYMQCAKQLEDPPNTYEVRCYRKLLASVRHHLSAQPEALDPASVVFTHPDLSGRNVLVMPPDVEGEPWSITGVVDWDECLALPPLAAFWCPSWLWNGAQDQSSKALPDYKQWEYDVDPDDEPGSQDSLAIKEAFIQIIETRYPGYMRMVQLGHKARIKQILYIAQNGCYDSGVERILDDIYHSAGLPNLFGSVESLVTGTGVTPGSNPASKDAEPTDLAQDMVYLDCPGTRTSRRVGVLKKWYKAAQARRKARRAVVKQHCKCAAQVLLSLCGIGRNKKVAD